MHYFLKFIFGIKLYMFRTVPLSKTCRVLLQKQIWKISASSWFYYKNLSRCTVTWTSKRNIYIYICVCVCVCVCVYVRMYVRTYVCVLVYTLKIVNGRSTTFLWCKIWSPPKAWNEIKLQLTWALLRFLQIKFKFFYWEAFSLMKWFFLWAKLWRE